MVDTEMTTTPTQKPETIRLADALKRRAPFLDGSSTIDHAEKELRRQHAEIAILTDAYCGAREDLAIWKRRALEAEEKLRAEIARLTAENEALRAVVAEAVAAEREACEERVVSLFEVLKTPYLPDITRAIHARDKA